MRISPDWVERVLASMERRLSQENPELTGRFAIFSRLVCDEGPPPCEARFDEPWGRSTPHE
jgi:hypothetical protein